MQVTAAPVGTPAVIRVLVVDDHRMFTDTIVQRLSAEPDLDVVGTAADWDAALRVAGLARPDVVLLDIIGDAAVGDGVARLLQAAPATRILVLTGRVGEPVLRSCIDAGCHGFITKDRSSDELVDALRSVAAGERPIQPSPQHVASAEPPGLSRREREVLVLLAEGHAAEGISKQLGISRNTARAHIQHVLDKLAVRSQLEAVALARRNGWV